MDEKEIKAMKEKIEAKELELKTKQTKLEEEYATKKTELEGKESELEEARVKFEADQEEIKKAKAKLTEYDTLKSDFETIKKDFGTLKTVAETAQKVAEVANAEAKRLTKEKKEIETDVKITQLVEAGKVLPAQKDYLKKVLLAEEGATIELTEGEGEKKTTRKISKTDAMLEVMAAGPAKVELGQRSKVVNEEETKDGAKELIAFVNMTDSEIAKMDPDKRMSLLERLNKYSK